jgi:excisionase family DNA binding protein
MTDGYLTKQKLMEELNISRTTLWRYEKEGLPSVKLLNSKRYDLDKVKDWIDKREPFDIPEGYLSSEEVQELLSVSRTTLHRLMKAGLPHEKHSHRVMFKKEDIDKWIEGGGL